MAKSKSSGKAKTKFDFQQFLLAKGEKIAMIVAGVGLALLALMGVLAASHADSPNTLSSKLKSSATTIDAKLTYSEGQKPADIDLPEGSAVYRVVRVDEYKTPNEWFSVVGTMVEKRVNPVILTAIQGQATYAIGGVGVWSIHGDLIDVIENRTQAQSNTRLINQFKKGSKIAAQTKAPQPPTPTPVPGPGGPPAGPGAGGNTGGRGGAGIPIQSGRSGEPEIVSMRIDDPNIEKAVLAINLQPVRMAVIEGIVPYKEQVEKYLRALRLDSDAALQTDGSEPLYKGLIVERKIFAADGKTEIQDWTPFDHVGAQIRDLYNITAEFVTEDPRYTDNGLIPAPVHQLYIRRPKLVRGAYAPTNLPALGQALQEIEKSGPPKDLTDKQKRITGKESLFEITDTSKNAAPGAGPGIGKGPPSEVRPGLGEVPNRNLGPGRAGGPVAAPRNSAAPVWKFQFIDPTIEPGKCYQYRVKLKAANPNYRKTDLVAIPSAATEEELVSKEWFVIPDLVFAPPEEFLYAQGEKFKKFGGSDFDTTVLRFHRWYDFIKYRDRSTSDPIGEWVCADIEAKRGQYIRQEKNFKLPIWSMAHSAYIFREQISSTGKAPTRTQIAKKENVRVNFLPTPDTLLVDFEGGNGLYRSSNGQSMQDECTAEVLLLADDGTTFALTCRNTAADKELPDRKQREENWEKWLREVEDASKKADSGPNTPPARGS